MVNIAARYNSGILNSPQSIQSWTDFEWAEVPSACILANFDVWPDSTIKQTHTGTWDNYPIKKWKSKLAFLVARLDQNWFYIVQKKRPYCTDFVFDQCSKKCTETKAKQIELAKVVKKPAG